jgi:hypothetical protein
MAGFNKESGRVMTDKQIQAVADAIQKASNKPIGEIPENFDIMAELISDKILIAAGSGLKHYMPQTKVKIMWEAREVLQETYRNGFKHGLEAKAGL